MQLQRPERLIWSLLTIRSIFKVHNPLEEQEGGLYELFEKSVGSETERMLAELKAAPDVLVLPHNEKPDAIETTMRAVARAGYKILPTVSMIVLSLQVLA